MTADIHPTVAAFLRALAAHQRRAEADAPPPQVITLHPAAVASYRRALADLGPILRGLDAERDRELVDAFRALIDRVVIHDREGGSVEAEVIGRLGPLVLEEMRGMRAVAEVRAIPHPPVTFGRFTA